MVIKKYSFFLIVCFCLDSCTANVIREKQTNTSEHTSLQEIKKLYPVYSSLDAEVLIKGRAEKNVFSYNGKISIEQGGNPASYKFQLVVRDLVFFSPLVTITINNDNLTWVDHLNNQSRNIKYINSSIIFFSRQQLASWVLIPLLTGNLPEVLIKNGKITDAGLRYSSPEYEIIGNFQDSKLTTLIYNPAESYNQVIYTLSGSIKNSLSRHFPENIKIQLAEDDYIDIIYQKIILK